MSYFEVQVLKLCLSCLIATICVDAHGTRTLPPTLNDLVAGSEHIGLATIRKAEDYYIHDAEGDLWCGVIYEGKWVDSLTGDTGHIEFTSKQILEVRGLYLLYLAKKSLPRKLLSTNSRTEAERTRRFERNTLCERTEKLPRTVYKAAGFFDKTHLAEEYKKGTWLEFPHFSENVLTEIVIMPTQLSIGGEVIPRDRFLHEFYDESKHGVVRTAGYQLIIFRAVDWTEYCSALIEGVNSAAGSANLQVSPAPPTFCEDKSPWLPALR